MRTAPVRGGGSGALGWVGVGQVQASGDAHPTLRRKLSFQENLRLSGVVTSRLNLWISRTQESGDQDPQVPRPSCGLTTGPFVAE